MPPLDRALALSQVHYVALLVAQDLNLDVARRLDGALHVDRIADKGGAGFKTAHLPGLFQLVQGVHQPHAAPPAAGHGFEAQREADFGGPFPGFLQRVEGAVAAGDDRHAGVFHGLAGHGLVTHPADGLRRGTDELDAARLAQFGKVRILRQRSVARMDGVRIGQLGRADDVGHVAVAEFAGGRPDADIFFGVAQVQRMGIGLRVHGHGGDAQILAGPDDAQCDLPAIGDEYLLKQEGSPGSNSSGTDPEQRLIVLDRFPGIDQDLDDFSLHFSLDLVHDLHGFDDAEGLAEFDLVALAGKGIFLG